MVQCELYHHGLDGGLGRQTVHPEPLNSVPGVLQAGAGQEDVGEVLGLLVAGGKKAVFLLVV